MIVVADIFGDIVSTIGNVLGGAASSAAAGIITVFAHAVLGSLTRAIEWLSTVWMNTPTPALVNPSGNATGTVAWMQGELVPLTAALAVGSVIVGGAKIAIAEAGHAEVREFTRWLVVYVLASACGVAFAAMLITTCDGFANYIIAQATMGSNFGDHLAQGLGLATQAVGSTTLQPQGGFLLGLAGTGASAMLAIVIGAFALVASFVEFMLMAFRGGVLVILCGLIPLAAAFSNVPTGERWLRRIAGWIVALGLYKLAAAFCYAAAFRLSAGTNVIAVMDGLALLVVSVLALPLLLRLTLPAAEHFTLHRGAAATTRTAMGAMPTGAVPLAATASRGGAVLATGAAEQFASGASRSGGTVGGPSGTGAARGQGGASRDGATGARGAAGPSPPGPPGWTGGDGAKRSDRSGGRPAGPAHPTGEGSPGGEIAGTASTGLAGPGRGASPNRETIDASRGTFEAGGEAPPGGSAAPVRSQTERVQPPEVSGGEDRTGTDEPWSGD